MFLYLYQVTNLVNSKIYIGVHKTFDLEDGYMGSGTVIQRAINFYGIDKFKKEILEFFNTEEEMYHRESEIVTIEFLNQSNVYNLLPGGKGGFRFINTTGLNGSLMGVYKKKQLLLNGDYAKGIGTKISNSNKATYKNGRKITGCASSEYLPTMVTKSKSDQSINKRKETYARINHQSGTLNSQFGTCWITDGNENKKVKIEDLSIFINLGWRRGRPKI